MERAEAEYGLEKTRITGKEMERGTSVLELPWRLDEFLLYFQ